MFQPGVDAGDEEAPDDAGDGEERQHAGAALRFTRDGSLLLVCRTAEESHIFDARSGEELRDARPRHLTRGVVSPDERLIAEAEADRIVVTELTTGQRVATLGPFSGRWRFGPLPNQLASWSGDKLELRDPRTGSLVQSQPRHRRVNVLNDTLHPALVFAPDGTRYAIREGEATIAIREYPNGRSIRTIARLSRIQRPIHGDRAT